MSSKREVFEEGGIANLISNIKTWASSNFADQDEVTINEAGLMSAADKVKLDSLPNGSSVGTITGITTTSPLSGSGTSGSVALSHANSGVTAASKGDTANKTPGFGDTFKVTSGTVNATGHLTAFADHTVKIPNATASSSADGLMSSTDKSKLDGIAAGATANAGTITGITTTSPLSGSGTSGSVAIAHATSGVSAGSKGDTTNQTPGFGETFKALSATVNATGHLTALADHDVTIPDAAVSSTSNGLMTPTMLSKLNGIADGATANAGTVTSVATGAGLTGGSITSSGTVKANLVSETKLTNAATAATETAGRVYPVALDTNGKLAVNVPWTDNNTTYTNMSASELETGTSTTGRLVSAQVLSDRFATKDVATTSADGLMSSSMVTKLNGVATGAEVNQNAFSNVKVGSTTVAADGKTDTLELVAGSNVTLTPDATNDKVTIAATDTTYTSKAAASGGTDVSLVTTGEKATWNAKTSNVGTVTSVGTGAGLTGGAITGSGTVKANLVSETKLSNSASAATEVANRVYPVALDKDGKLAVNVPWTDTNTQTVTGVKGNSESSYRTGNVNITAANIGLGNVNNTSDANKPVSTATQTALDAKVSTSLLGEPNGVATLDSSGTVPESQLPSYVDDVLEYTAQSSFPTTGESGKIYVDTSTNKTYRWSGSTYVEISASIALGETSSTAYRGDRGKAAYAHAVTNKGSAFASGLYKITTNSEGHVTAATAVAKADITALGIPSTNTWTAMVGATSSANGSVGYVNATPPKDGYNTKYLRADGTWTVPPNTTYSVATTSANGLMSSTDKAKSDSLSGIYPVKGTQTAATGTWTGTINAPALYDGMTIAYYLPYNGSGNATLNLTLSGGGTTGAINCYYTNATRMTTQYAAGSTIFLTYWSAGSISVAGTATTDNRWTGSDYNTNTTYTSKAAASGGTEVSLVTTGEKYTWNSKTSNTGTVTKVSTGAGLTGGDITTTGTIAHSNSVTAQTTQAIYPIKIDSEGHISAYGSAVTPLTSHQTIKQDGVTGATANRFGTCSTAAATAAKTVSVTAGTFNLETGAKVTVKFSNANTADSPTLNVNSKGAKNIFSRGAQITTGGNKALLAGTCDFVYDGTQWHLVGNYVDTNTTYSSKAAASGGTDVSLVTTGEKYTWNSKTSNAGTVTSVATGVGLTGGSITSSGTLKAKLRSETALTNDSAAATETAGRVYPVAVDKSGYLAVNVPWTDNNSDTKNTAGSTDTSSKIFLVGATSQAANPQTYSHDTVYVGTDGHAYSNSKQVVNLSDTQALTNKTYNGYTLAAACAKAVTDSSSASAISTGTSLVTERDVYYGLPTINNGHAYTSSSTFYAPTAGGTSGYTLVGNGTTAAPVWQAGPYGNCATAAGTAAKTVDVTNFKLTNGAHVYVRFAAANTAAAPTLNVNSTGAKSMYFGGVAITNANFTWRTDAVYHFVYASYNNSTYGWILVGASGGTTWGLLKGAAS